MELRTYVHSAVFVHANNANLRLVHNPVANFGHQASFSHKLKIYARIAIFNAMFAMKVPTVPMNVPTVPKPVNTYTGVPVNLLTLKRSFLCKYVLRSAFKATISLFSCTAKQ